MLQGLQAAGAHMLENIRHRAPAHLGVRLCEGGAFQEAEYFAKRNVTER